MTALLWLCSSSPCSIRTDTKRDRRFWYSSRDIPIMIASQLPGLPCQPCLSSLFDDGIESGHFGKKGVHRVNAVESYHSYRFSPSKYT